MEGEGGEENSLFNLLRAYSLRGKEAPKKKGKERIERWSEIVKKSSPAEIETGGEAVVMKTKDQQSHRELRRRGEK